MTDKLRETLHTRADRAGFAPLDLDAIRTAGDRGVRRRRTAAIAAGAAGLAAAVALTATLTGSDPARTAPDPADRFPTGTRPSSPVYAVGATVVDDDRTIELAHPVDRLVRTLDGYVYLSDGTVAGYVDGREQDLGAAGDPGAGSYPEGLLQADHDGHAAAWIERDGDAADLAVVDTRTLETRRIPLEPPGAGERLRLHDVDGSTAYLADGRGEVVLDLETGEHRATDVVAVDVEAGVVAGVRSSARGAGIVLAGPDGEEVLGYETSAILSPDGRYVASDDILGQLTQVSGNVAAVGRGVYDSRADRTIDLDLRGAVPAGTASSSSLAGWLDATTVIVVITRAGGPGAIHACTMPSGACTEVVDDLPPGAVVPGRTQ